MFSKKLFFLCPRCHSKLNPAKTVKSVSICEHCTWAGSYQSESHQNWIEYKVSAYILFAALVIFAGIAQVAKDSGYHINPKLTKVFSEQQ